MKDCIADPCPCRLIVQMTSKYGWSECEQIQFLTSSILKKKDKKKLLSFSMSLSIWGDERIEIDPSSHVLRVKLNSYIGTERIDEHPRVPTLGVFKSSL